MIREDTNLKGFDVAQDKDQGSDVGAGGGFMIREDTNLKGVEVDIFASPSAALMSNTKTSAPQQVHVK